jgi:hypothetical protein
MRAAPSSPCVWYHYLHGGQLADCCTALGLNVTKHVKSGWKINKDSVDKLLPDLEKTSPRLQKMSLWLYRGLITQPTLGLRMTAGWLL